MFAPVFVGSREVKYAVNFCKEEKGREEKRGEEKFNSVDEVGFGFQGWICNFVIGEQADEKLNMEGNAMLCNVIVVLVAVSWICSFSNPIYWVFLYVFGNYSNGTINLTKFSFFILKS
ncbi:hypothetical protein TorRG33x02_260900 [Trema orientale]|uniref:Uncharacterized protein n=1 Tax=Trema orientale TaxID=63057 RepID=A0A2P5D6G6_TREOI|nr:hypothetical protein TorRG33x02_260900 [Trema orientale]